MKYLQRLLVLFTISATIFSCQKEYSVENPSGSNTPTAQWEFKEAGVQFKGPVDTVAVDTIGPYKFLTINGRSDDGSSRITLQAFDTTLKVGVYKTPKCLFAYSQSGSIIYQTDQTAIDSFTITITKLDTSGVTGTFSGRAVTGSAAKKIVDGKFNAVFKTSTTVTPPSTKDSGQVVLWSKAGCGGGNSTSPINVTVGGKAGQITKFLTTEPTTCDPPGTYSLKLPVGTYPWVAKCGTDSITGTVVVTKGGCTKQIVDFTVPVTTLDYFPMTKNSNWTSVYDSVGVTAADSTYTVSTGTTTTFNGSAYTVFNYTDNLVGYDDTLYYRKGTANDYWQYYPATTNIFGFDTPKPVEYIFLKDNVPVNTTWTGNVVTGTISGNAVSARIDGKILEIAANVTVGGIQYSNVIKVRTSYYYIIAGNAQEAYRQEQWFAKGKGLVRFQEFITPFTSPITILNTTRIYIAP